MNSTPVEPITISIQPVNVDSAAEPPSPTESTHSNHSTLSIHSIDKIESSFHSLRDTFVFPSSLDFTPSPSAPSPSAVGAQADKTSPTDTLAFTPTNAPLRAYEHALNGLLAQLDEVESEGDESVRGRRREVVREVERELERVEGRVGEMRRAVMGEDAAVEVEVEVEEVKEAKEVEPVTIEAAHEAEADITSTTVVEQEPQPATTTFELVDTSDVAATEFTPSTETISAPAAEDANPHLLTVPVLPAVIISDESPSHVESSPKPADVELPAANSSPSPSSSDSTPLEPLTFTGEPVSVDSEPSLPSSSDSSPVSITETSAEPSQPSQTAEMEEVEPAATSPATPEFLSSFTKDQFSFPPRRSFASEESQTVPLRPAEGEVEDVVVIEKEPETGTSEGESESSVSADGSEWSEVDA